MNADLIGDVVLNALLQSQLESIRTAINGRLNLAMNQMDDNANGQMTVPHRYRFRAVKMLVDAAVDLIGGNLGCEDGSIGWLTCAIEELEVAIKSRDDS